MSWLRFGPDVATRNVEVQGADPSSVLCLYRRLIALRATAPALQVGSLNLRSEAAGDVVAYTREVPGQVVMVILNPGRTAAEWRLAGGPDEPGWRPLLDTAGTRAVGATIPAGTTVGVGPGEGLILERIGWRAHASPLLP